MKGKAERERRLTAARSALASLRTERDRVAREAADAEARIGRAKSEMDAISHEAVSVAQTIRAWGDDRRASPSDIFPQSIENWVRQSTLFVSQLDQLNAPDCMSGYQSAYARYRTACTDLRDAESTRLRTIYAHRNLLDDLSRFKPKTQNETKMLNAVGFGSITDWIAQGSKVNELIDKAVDDLNSSVRSMQSEEPNTINQLTAAAAAARQKSTDVETKILKAESELRSLGG